MNLCLCSQPKHLSANQSAFTCTKATVCIIHSKLIEVGTLVRLCVPCLHHEERKKKDQNQTLGNLCVSFP